jgi:general stress protein YciG
MDRAKQREIASKGGKAAHQKGTAHEWTSEEARDAGRKGGIASHQRRREQSGGQSGASSGDTSAERVTAMDRSDMERNSMNRGGAGSSGSGGATGGSMGRDSYESDRGSIESGRSEPNE